MTTNKRLLDAPLSTMQTQRLGNCNYCIDTRRIEQSRGKWGANSKWITFGWIVASPILAAAGLCSAAALLVTPRCLANRIASFWTKCICRKLDTLFATERNTLLQHCHGRVLDIGCGGGTYLRYYASTCTEVVALEPNVTFHPTILQEAQRVELPLERLTLVASDTETYLKQVLQQAKQDDGGDNYSFLFDFVILGNVLCEVDNVVTTLQAVDALLRPGGHVYFCEHVGCPTRSWMRTIQDAINPVWKIVSHGCNINHDSLVAMASMPNWEVISWTYHQFRIMLGPLVLGLARKKGE